MAKAGDFFILLNRTKVRKKIIIVIQNDSSELVQVVAVEFYAYMSFDDCHHRNPYLHPHHSEPSNQKACGQEWR